MARAPTKTCPKLHRILTEAPIELLARFLAAKPFEKLAWLSAYRIDPADQHARDQAARMLAVEPKAKLQSLETEAARVITIADKRGQFVLERLVRNVADRGLGLAYRQQPDELARSLWCWLDQVKQFEAAESILHLKLYRRYDKHYQTFLAAPTSGNGRHDGAKALADFIAELEEGLDRGSGCRTDRFDIGEDGDEPAAEMYLIRHPNLPTVAREIDDKGEVSSFYFRPPGEAMVVFVPSTGRLHVRADTRAIRHLVRKAFVEKALAQDISYQPADFQAYDISRFLNDFELPALEDPEALIKKVSLIKIDASIGKLSNRISVATTLDESVKKLIQDQEGLDKVFEGAVAIRFVEIAVRYRRAGRDVDETLNFSISDGNTCSLLSLDDAFEQAFGHRLLRGWRIMKEGRAPRDSDLRVILPAILALWDSGKTTVSGAWLMERKLDVDRMTDLGFLVPSGVDDIDVIEDQDGLGVQEATAETGLDEADLTLSEGQSSSDGAPGRHRQYRVRPEWLVQYLKEKIVQQFGWKTVEIVTPDLIAIGTLRVSEREVPVYLARRLSNERALAETDTALRAMSDLGTGLVLNAGRRAGSALVANVLVSLADYLTVEESEPVIDLDALRAAFARHRNLAQGGETVSLERSGESAGTLFVPGRGSIYIDGAHRLMVIQKLVDNHNSRAGPMKTGDLTQEFTDQSLANIFGKVLWGKLQTGFLRSPGRGRWEIAI
jgi:hypothetical protein